MKLIATVDGGYFPLNGRATIGVAVAHADCRAECASLSCRLRGNGADDATVAEWEAVFAGITVAYSLGATSLTLITDRSDIAGGQFRYRGTRRVLQELAGPLEHFQIRKEGAGGVRRAHALATAASKGDVPFWEMRLDWVEEKRDLGKPIPPGELPDYFLSARRQAELTADGNEYRAELRRLGILKPAVR